MKTVTLDELIAGLQAIKDAYGSVAVTVEGAVSVYSSELYPPPVEGLPDSFRASVQSWWWENVPF